MVLTRSALLSLFLLAIAASPAVAASTLEVDASGNQLVIKPVSPQQDGSSAIMLSSDAATAQTLVDAGEDTTLVPDGPCFTVSATRVACPTTNVGTIRIFGGLGQDVITMGNLTAKAGVGATIDGGSGSDLITGGPGPDII
jgi:hypothetical protein